MWCAVQVFWKKINIKKNLLSFLGLDDNGNSSFTQIVILNGLTKTKLIMLMEDLSHWKSAPPGYPISKEQMILCLKNVAILHAKFWGLKNLDSLNIGIGKAEQDLRPAAYQKMSKLFLKTLVKNPKMLRKALNSLLKCELVTIWFQKFSKYLKKSQSLYRMRAIITCRLYTFYPLYEVKKHFFKGFFS